MPLKPPRWVISADAVAPKELKEPPSTLAVAAFPAGLRVTILTAPSKDEVPYTRAAGPSSTSMRSMSQTLTGKSKELWPVCGSVMLIPSRSTATWL